MSLLDKIYNFWSKNKRCSTVIYYMICTFLFMVTLGVCLGLFALPIILAGVFTWHWLFSWLITIPLCIGAFAKFVEIVD